MASRARGPCRLTYVIFKGKNRMKPFTNEKKMLVLSGLALAASMLAPQAAFAQDKGFYIGLGVGQSDAKEACTELGGVGFSGSCDDTSTGKKIFLGYQFNPNFALEGGYVDLGKFKANGAVLGIPVSAYAKAKTWQLVAVGTLPLANNFSVFGKAGFHNWDADAGVTALGLTSTTSDKGIDFTFGLGAGYDITKNLGLRLEWERFRHVGEDDTTGKSNVDLLSVGLRYRF